MPLKNCPKAFINQTVALEFKLHIKNWNDFLPNMRNEVQNRGQEC